MTIYLDSDFKCHTVASDEMTPVETARFDGKCKEFVEGYRLVPSGMTWTREDGTVFSGEMISPWKDYGTLATIQSAVDETQAQADTQMMELLDVIEQLAM